jgi:hypothetical protein
MYVVAITELVTPVDDEAAALAADLGTTLYEERVNLNAGLPVVVLTTPERQAAVRLLQRIRQRGHGAVAVDDSAVISTGSMISMRRFVLEADAITTPDHPGERLPYGELLALLKAEHRTRTETHAEVTSKQFSVGRALVTGGVLLSKNVKRDATTVTRESRMALYLFRATAATPWILWERGTQYTTLGKQLAPSSMQNFTTTIAVLRERAPQAVYDERLVNARTASSGVDLLAHLLALSIARGPQR